MIYLTPDRYRAMGFGAEDLEDSDLRAILNRASRAVDRYCSAPMLPQRHSFRGGAIANEEHRYDIGDGVFHGAQRQVWLWHTPLKAMTALRLYVTNTQFVDFPAGELFVTKDYIEIISLAVGSVGLYGSAILPVVGLGQPLLRASYTYGYSFTETDEVLEDTDARTYRASNQFWDDTAVTIKVGGSTVATGFTLDREEGVVIFDTQQVDEVRASYGYTLPSEISEATGIIATDLMGERAITAGGMSSLRSLKVAEITIERNVPRSRGVAAASIMDDIPDRAARLLNAFNFISVG